MNMLYRFLLPLAACAAFAAAQPVQAAPSIQVDKAKLQAMVDKVKDAGLRAKLQSLLNQLPNGAVDKAKLEALAKEVMAVLQGKAPGSSGGGGSTPAPAPSGPLKALVLYDTASGTEYDKMGQAYAIMLRNLIGHFDSQVDMLPVQQYTAGKLAGYKATFYLGALFNTPVPAAFVKDACTTTSTVVLFKYNMWQFTDPACAEKGFRVPYVLGLNDVPSPAQPDPGFYSQVKYKDLDFDKYYAVNTAATPPVVNADPDVGYVEITDAAKVQTVVPVANPKRGTTLPYVVRSGNFWYWADVPFSFIGPRDRYLVFADILYDILGMPAPAEHKALIRLEDVGAMVSVDAMKQLSDFLHSRKIPFSIAVIPRYRDGLGAYNGGTPQEVHLSQASNLRTALNYARQRGAEFVMHGFTHQYGAMKNPHTGVSGDDYEFWNIVDNQPVPEDSVQWVANRLDQGIKDMRAAGYNIVAWEAPHYHTSAIAAKTASQVFRTTYQRVVYYTADKPRFFGAPGKDFSAGQFYPYVIRKDHYGQYVLPENLGNIEYDIRTMDPTSFYNYTADDLILNAKYAKAVRGGFASFFFHPFWLEPNLGVNGFEDFKKTIDGITQLGFTWVAPSTLSQR